MTTPGAGPATGAAAVTAERDPFDARVARGATGVLAAFNAAELLAPGDVHVARRLAHLGGRGDPGGAVGGDSGGAARGEPEDVLLAVALAVRAIRNGSVCVDLSEISRTAAGEGEQAVHVGDLPWPQPAAWQEAVAGSPLVATGEPDGPDAGPDRPLRLVGDLLYLERYWGEEELVRREFVARAGPVAAVDPARLRAALDRLFHDAGGERQRLAAAVAALRPISVIAGGPGTGKTTTVARLLALLHDLHDGPARLRIALAAPTGKAAARLTETVAARAADLPPADRERVAGTTASTIHRLLDARGRSNRFRHHRGNRLPHDVVVVDETSMVSLTLMARLLDAVRPDARLVLVGDPEQLASVEAGAVLGDLAGADGTPEPALEAALRAGGARTDGSAGATDPIVHGVVRLDRNWRFRGAIAGFAAAVRSGDADAALHLLRSAPAELAFVEADPATVPADRLAGLRDDVVRAGLDLIGAAETGDTEAAVRRLDEHRLLCGHRRGPYGVTRWTLEAERWLSAARPGYDTSGPWYPGRPLLVTANDYDLNLFNGDTGVVVDTVDGPRAVFARDGVPTAFVPARLGSVSTVHAMTVHRSQGSQFRRVTVVLPPAESPLMTRELLYTAVTRAERAVRVIGTEDAVRAAIARPAGRASGLRGRLGPGGRQRAEPAEPEGHGGRQPTEPTEPTEPAGQARQGENGRRA